MKFIIIALSIVPAYFVTLLLLVVYGDDAAAEFVDGVQSYFDSL